MIMEIIWKNQKLITIRLRFYFKLIFWQIFNFQFAFLPIHPTKWIFNLAFLYSTIRLFSEASSFPFDNSLFFQLPSLVYYFLFIFVPSFTSLFITPFSYLPSLTFAIRSTKKDLNLCSCQFSQKW